jgi:hypothetical protein
MENDNPLADPEFIAETDRLAAARAAGQITTYDYNAGRKRALEAARQRIEARHAGKDAAVSAPTEAPPAEPTAAPPPPPAATPSDVAGAAAAASGAPTWDSPQEDPEFIAESDRLVAARSAGQITTYEYNAGRKRALEAAQQRFMARFAGHEDEDEDEDEDDDGDASEPAEAPPAAATPSDVAGAAAASEAPASETSGAFGGDKKTNPKRWSSSGRGDDPSVRVVLPPVKPGIGDGKAFLFLFGLKKARQIDQDMLARERAEIDDDIAVLRDAGYTVVVDPQASYDDFLQTLYGEAEQAPGLIPAGFYWSAHGHDDGAIECCDGSVVRPKDVETARVSPGLKLVVFGACYTGAFARTWRDALGGRPLVVGWGRPVTIDRAVAFLQTNPDTDTDLDDLIARYMLTDTPVPELPASTTGVAASLAGQKAVLSERIAPLVEILSAIRWRECESWYEIDVPIPNGRHQIVRLFATQSAEPFIEGKELIGAESIVGELSGVVDPEKLLSTTAQPSYARIALVKGPNDLPEIIAQGFMPLGRMTNTEIAALAYQVAAAADRLERDIFGYDAPV